MPQLLDPFPLTKNITLPNRIVMAPTTTKGATVNGTETDADIAYYRRRSQAAGMLITGAGLVDPLGEKFSYQLALDDDSKLPGLTKLAKACHAHGSVAIAQLYHAGVNANIAYQKFGKCVGPSAKSFHQLDHPVTELSDADVEAVIGRFAQAAKRALQAGFDGVELHGAYGHLIQQFFSPYSNHRSGKFAAGPAFALAVLAAVKAAAQAVGKPDAVIGYRLTQSETHADGVGYTIADTLKLVDQLCTAGITYIHATEPTDGQALRDAIASRAAFIYVPGATDLAQAQAGLEYGDLVAMSHAIVTEPDFAKKLAAGEADQLHFTITSRSQAEDLALPPRMIPWLLGNGPTIAGMQHIND
ncbi:oxidoreductase [Lacticaseibacillus jixiensis]|uniref:oxidoreductase n=1 Tax=Lacticaseibacillus jixiensis TaxID=3231926 RepID=UPI0036F28AA8